MRRSDREITDFTELVSIIEKCDVCRIGMSDHNTPYIVPVNFGYETVDDQLVIYFHGAKQGKKLDIISQNPSVCFEMDCGHRLIENELACEYTMEYESVIGFGTATVLTNESEKAQALQQILGKYTDKSFTLDAKAVNRVEVLKIIVDQVTAKRLQKM